MSSPFIWAGNFAKSLKKYLNLNDQSYIMADTFNPSAVATNAPKGSMFLRSGGTVAEVYLKNDNGNTTNWTLVGSTGIVTNLDNVLTDGQGDIVIDSNGNIVFEG